MKRYIYSQIINDLKEKSVFIGGPRQVGKTYLAKSISLHPNQLYLNWDFTPDKKTILSGQWPAEPALIILDEIHKYIKWKTFIKGHFDKFNDLHSFLITGSARLDVYRKGGDSLQGRYHYYRLHPLTLAETTGLSLKLKERKIFTSLQFQTGINHNDLEPLFEFGGFPEPFLRQNNRFFRRWQNERMERLFREDLRDLEKIPDLSRIEILSQILPERIGSPLSINSLKEDLEASHKALNNWVNILERLYFLFRVPPYSSSLIRSLKKEKKVYLWDWSVIKDLGSKFENMVASHLLKYCHYLKDWEGYKVELYYLRDVDKREVDFLVVCDDKPWFAVEAKASSTKLSKHLLYFSKKLEISQLYQVVLQADIDYFDQNVRVISAHKFFTALM